MKKILLVLLILILVLAGAVVWHEWPRPLPPTLPQTLFTDLSLYGKSGPGSTSTAGRTLSHLINERALPGLAVSDDQTAAKQMVQVKLPQGATLVFDLYIPPYKLMHPLAKAVYTVTADGAPVFTYNYRQDWIALGIEVATAYWPVYKPYRSPVRRFAVDLSQFGGKEVTLGFAIETDLRPMDQYRNWFVGMEKHKVNQDLSFLSPRIFSQEAPDKGKPNILLITAGGLGTDFNAQNASATTTLSARSVVYEQAYTPVNQTRAALAAMLTFENPEQLALPLTDQPLKPEAKTAFRILAWPVISPMVLKSRGYVGGFVGDEPYALADTVYGVDFGYDTAEYLSETDGVVARAKSFLDANKDRPFMLHAHFSDRGMADADDNLAELLEALGVAGLTDRTLVIVTSDRGKTNAPGKPQGAGLSLYDSDVHVPLILSMPGVFDGGKRIDTLISNAMIVGMIDAVTSSDGNFENLKAEIVAPKDNWETTLFFAGPGIVALRNTAWKAIVKDREYPGVDPETAVDKGRAFELYDLKNDPQETQNLAGTRPEIENEYLSQLYENIIEGEQERAKVIAKLTDSGIADAQTLFAKRKSVYQVAMTAGEADREYQVLLYSQRSFQGYSTADFKGDDYFAEGEGRQALTFLITVPAGEQKIFGYTPFPPDEPIYAEFEVDGIPMSPDDMHMGRYRLPYMTNPMTTKGRDFRLLGADVPPTYDPKTEAAIFLWRPAR